MTVLTDKLLRDAAKTARDQMLIQGKLSEAFESRYGLTYSDVDADEIIDILDYGAGGKLTIADCDRIMGDLGHPPRESEQ